MALEWTYNHFHSGQYPAVAEQILNHLNGLDRQDAAFAKVASSDQNNGEARGAVFWTNEAPDSVPEMPDSDNWKMETFETTNDYDAIFKKIRDKLNNLDEAQAYYSKVDFTNAQGSPAFITIYWLD